jgi:hypothetical protein
MGGTSFKYLMHVGHEVLKRSSTQDQKISLFNLIAIFNLQKPLISSQKSPRLHCRDNKAVSFQDKEQEPFFLILFLQIFPDILGHFFNVHAF